MKVVIVSGGSSGIGHSCCSKFLKSNYFVYNIDIKENLEFNNNPNYMFLKTDVTCKKQLEHSISIVIEHHKKIDSLIISAGQHLSANIEDTTDEQLDHLINLNIKGAFWLIKLIIPYMKSANYGNIVTIGSDQSTVAKKSSSAYGLTKSAISSLTKSVALDYAQYGIRANCIGAGTIDTPLYKNAISLYSKKSGISLEDIEKEEANEQPIGRVGHPDEVAELVYFIVQDSAKFITGALIPIDGGYTAK